MSSLAIEKAARAQWTMRQKLLIALCALVSLIDGVDVSILSFVGPAIQDDLGMPSSRLGIVFSAGLAGMALGSIIFSPMADRIGKRPVLVAAMTVMTLGTLASSQAGGVLGLLLARFVIGLSIGTVVSAAASLAADSAPDGRRAFAVGVMQAGYPIGATLAAFASAFALQHFSWREVLIVSAVPSAAVIPIIWFALRRMQPVATPESAAVKEANLFQTLNLLVADGRMRMTILLWVAAFSGFMVSYFIVSWIPKLAIKAGLGLSSAIMAGGVSNIGVVIGVLTISWLGSERGLNKLLFASLSIAAIVQLIFGAVAMSVGAVLLTAFALGFFLLGAFSGLAALVAQSYPPAIGSTAIGWSMGIGRFGALLGPLAGGFMISAGLSLLEIFAIFCVPLMVCAFSLLLTPAPNFARAYTPLAH